MARIIGRTTVVPEGYIALTCPLCGVPTLFGPEDFPLTIGADDSALTTTKEEVRWDRACCIESVIGPAQVATPLHGGLRAHLAAIGALPDAEG